MNHLPILELVDRLCIARVKYRRIGQNQPELDWYEKEWNHYRHRDDLVPLVSQLEDIHNIIWDLESELKQGHEDDLSLEEIGRRAIAIRNWNNKRISIKNQISEMLGSQIREIKKEHLSE